MSIPVVHVPASLNIHRCIFFFFCAVCLFERMSSWKFSVWRSWSMVEAMQSYHAYWMDRDMLLIGFLCAQRKRGGGLCHWLATIVHLVSQDDNYTLWGSDRAGWTWVGGWWAGVSPFLDEAFLSVSIQYAAEDVALCGTAAAAAAAGGRCLLTRQEN